MFSIVQMKISRMGRIVVLTVCSLVMLSVFAIPIPGQSQRLNRGGGLKVVRQLPAPSLSDSMSVEEAIHARRSIRQFTNESLNFVQMGQLAWAGQGITDKERGFRAAPSAGALYPIVLYFVTPEGMFIYNPDEHSLGQVSQSDLRRQLSGAASGQRPVEDAACSIVIAGSVRKVATRYGNKAERFMLLEAGCIAENIQLQAVALGLGSVPIGSFETKNVARVCRLPVDLEPLLIVCVGHPLITQGRTQSSGESVTTAQRAVLIVPYTDFREEELFETQRILTEAGVETVIASSRIGPLRGVLGRIAASETTLDQVRVEDFDAVIFVDGPGTVAYFNNPTVLGIARRAAAGRKIIAAIDIAPTILANAGVLNGLKATGFRLQRESMLKSGANYTGVPVERDGSVITASTPAAAVPFAQAIVDALRERQVRSGKVP